MQMYNKSYNSVNNNSNVSCFDKESDESNDEQQEHMISLKGFNMSYKNKNENLKTIDKIDNNKRIIKLVLDNVDINPKKIMEHIVNLLKEKTSLHTTIKINNEKYKIKYKEIPPTDHILFTENIKNITNCKYVYIGILKISKYIKKSSFDEKTLHAWQNMEEDF
ncbi:conserved protein, unknown function [Hepatocystis sp. ex Piliocolobus tephrosceles]|nr:conserved protein, unknown function [Hepatocystis sp. ex Piliocolobus tephrosceles]